MYSLDYGIRGVKFWSKFESIPLEHDVFMVAMLNDENYIIDRKQQYSINVTQRMKITKSLKKTYSTLYVIRINFHTMIMNQ